MRQLQEDGYTHMPALVQAFVKQPRELFCGVAGLGDLCFQVLWEEGN